MNDLLPADMKCRAMIISYRIIMQKRLPALPNILG